MSNCDLCEYDRHVCPGCGVPTAHRRNNVAVPCDSCADRGVKREDYNDDPRAAKQEGGNGDDV